MEFGAAPALRAIRVAEAADSLTRGRLRRSLLLRCDRQGVLDEGLQIGRHGDGGSVRPADDASVGADQPVEQASGDVVAFVHGCPAVGRENTAECIQRA